MRTIIVATNYSRCADNAIKYAAALARRTNSKLILFNSFELPVPATNTALPVSVADEMLTANRDRLKKIAFDTAMESGIEVTSLTRTSFLEEELDYQVKRLNAALVIIGLSRFYYKYGFEHIAASVIRHAKFPVLAVPEEASFKGIEKILFAFNPSCIRETNQLPLLAEVARYFDAQVQVCHVEERATALASPHHSFTTDLRIETILKGVSHSYKEVWEDEVTRGIEGAIEDFKADLLAMVPHKYGFWEGLWHKSKTGTMTRRAHIPLLTLPNPAITKK